MARAIRSPMQWRPSNRKLAVCLTGKDINKAYSNIEHRLLNTGICTSCDTFEFVAEICIIAGRPSPIVVIFKTHYG